MITPIKAFLAHHRQPSFGLLMASVLIVICASFQLAYSAETQQPEADCPELQPLHCPLQSYDLLEDSLLQIKSPDLKAPVAPTPIISRPTAGQPRLITYDVITRGNVTSDLATFKAQAQQTFDDQRGWSRAGLRFSPVATGGNFTLVLASADQLPAFSSGCSSLYSCRVGRYVIINQDRWEGATSSWNAAGGTLRDYRHMVINHETGHWLGHGHSNCPAAGGPAPIMQQQSINLQGCTFNPWPLSSELRAPNLGIY